MNSSTVAVNAKKVIVDVVNVFVDVVNVQKRHFRVLRFVIVEVIMNVEY
jgi:hypothetical protein